MARENASSGLPQPLRATASLLSHVPGASTVGHAAEGALNAVGSVSPRGRRIAAYTGAGLLGAAGVVEWPVAVAGAAAVWLTQQKPGDRKGRETADRPVSTSVRTSTGASARSTSAVRHSTSEAARARGTSTRFGGPRARSGGTPTRSAGDGTPHTRHTED
jgi:hypothetical protein